LFTLTENHAIWWDQAPVTDGNALFFVEHDGACDVSSLSGEVIIGSNATEAVDAVRVGLGSGQSYAYFDNPGLPLQAAELPDNVSVTPLSTPTGDQMYPGGNDSDPTVKGFVWEEDGDIWHCADYTCHAGGIQQVTQSADRDTRPRMSGEYIVWENETTGQVMIRPGASQATIAIDDGAAPDVHGDWVVYMKKEPSPDTACQWTTHWQLWAYGPLSNTNPTSMRLSTQAYWGAADFVQPRLTDSYVVFLVKYLYAPKTVVGIYPVSGFGTANTPMLELDDGGDGASVDAWEDNTDGSVSALYRDVLTGQARLKCCESPEW
jgi:hypothetical protein